MFYVVDGKITFPMDKVGQDAMGEIQESIERSNNGMMENFNPEFLENDETRTVLMSFGLGESISLREREEFDEFIKDLTTRYMAIKGRMEWRDDDEGLTDIDYYGTHAIDAEMEDVEQEIKGLIQRRNKLKALGAKSTELLQAIDGFPLMNNGSNPHGYTADVFRSGDTGIYNEVRVGVYRTCDITLMEVKTDPIKMCVADVLVGLDDSGELRVLVTTGNNGDDGRQFAINPTLKAEDAIQMPGQWERGRAT